MRVTNLMTMNSSLQDIRKNKVKLDKLQNQASSTNQIRYASDDPINTVNQMKYKSELNKLEQYKNNINDAQGWLEIQDSLLSQSTDILQRTRTLTLQAANDTLVADDRKLIAKEINQLLEALVDEANSTHGGSYVFGGTEILDTPFNEKPFKVTKGTSQDDAGSMTDVITKVEYKGDFKEIYREIETGSRMKVNENGNDVFMATPNQIKIPSGLNDPSAKLNNLSGVTAGEEGYFKINDELIYFDSVDDSLIDLKNLINSKDLPVEASLNGELTGNMAAPPANANTALNLSGTFKLNNVNVTVVNSDSLSSIADKINTLTRQTGVTASINSAGNNLVLSGGAEFSFDYASGINSVLSDLGITVDVSTNGITGTNNAYQSDVKGGTFEINGTQITIADNSTMTNIRDAINGSGAPGIFASININNQLEIRGVSTLKDSTNDSNLTSDVFKKLAFLTEEGNVKVNINTANVTQQYELNITSKDNKQLFLNDVADSHFLRNTGVIDSSEKSPNNITSNAEVEKRSIFDVLIELRDDLLDNTQPDLSGENMGYIDSSLKNVLSIQGSIGAKINRLEKTENRNDILTLNNQERFADVSEVDMAEVLMGLQQMQTVQSAALQAASQIYRLSLMDYM